MSKVVVTLVKSINRASEKQKKVVQALGLKKLGQSALHQDNAAIRGMVNTIPHLVSIEEVQE